MIIFKQNFLLKKNNRKNFLKNLKSQVLCKRAKRIWQSHTIKLATLDLSTIPTLSIFSKLPKNIANINTCFPVTFRHFIRGGDALFI